MRKAAAVIAAVILFSAAVFFFMRSETEKKIEEKVGEKLEHYEYPLAFEDIINKCSAEYGLDPEFICAVILTESSFEPDAASGAGAVGLMQLTAIANEDVCSRTGWDINADLTDPETNITRGCYYLAYLMWQFEEFDTALAAYNAGYGNVRKWLSDPECSDDGTTLKYIPFEETRNYVERVNKARIKYRELYFTDTKET